MKLIRFGKMGEETPGILINDQRFDISAFGEDYDENFFGNNGIERLKDWWKRHQTKCPEISSDTRWAAPIVRPSKIVCVGLNYVTHAKESNMELPKEPLIFFKASSALCGPFDNVIYPKLAQKLDYEVELAVIIGKKATEVSEEEAMQHVAGYTIHNDISERYFQLESGGQWVKGKSCDTFAPIGPYLATTDEINNPHQLALSLSVNGEIRQKDTTDSLYFKIPHLISYISHYMSLLPGDIISTGTPAGVGLGFSPPKYVTPGDEMELVIEGLGRMKQRVI
ncbi:MAG: fumarylacetoacetate hydrolase family protein [Bacteroidota bacterium]